MESHDAHTPDAEGYHDIINILAFRTRKVPTMMEKASVSEGDLPRTQISSTT